MKSIAIRLVPTFAEEKLLWSQGIRFVAGVDEVGRGALAGPVMAAAVIFPPELKKAKWTRLIRDSKLLTSEKREIMEVYIQENAVAVGIGMITHEIIDSEGIAKAARLAMKSAIRQLSPLPQYVLVDYFKLPEVSLPQKGVVDGDTLCFSIACASIVAKVARDRLMVALDSLYPGYGLARHKGYSTEEHLTCLQKKGPCPIHRRSFQPVQDAIGLL